MAPSAIPVLDFGTDKDGFVGHFGYNLGYTVDDNDNIREGVIGSLQIKSAVGAQGNL